MKINSVKFAVKKMLGLAAVAVIVSAVGCETLTSDSAASKKKKKDASWFSFKKKEYQVPQSMTATWTHDILTLPGKPATRGFGGRFYFYNEKTQAIPVDGDLVVYGFDDTNKQQSNGDLSQPDKKFRFTAEQLTTHFTEGELGASYSVWIPWDEAYGAPKKIMLIPTFQTKDGRTVRGAAANLSLPGISKSPPEGPAVAQASAMLPLAANNPFPSNNPFQVAPNSGIRSESSGLRTTTIQVPSSSLMRPMPPSMTPTLGSSFSENSFQVNSNEQPNMMIPPLQNPIQAIAPDLSLSTPPAGTQSRMFTQNANGWISPEYAQPDWSSLTPRSVPSQFPAPASQGAQPFVYPTR